VNPIQIVEKMNEPELILERLPTKVENFEKKKPPLPDARKSNVNTQEENNVSTEVKKITPPVAPSKMNKPSLVSRTVEEFSPTKEIDTKQEVHVDTKKTPPVVPSKAKKPSLIGKPVDFDKFPKEDSKEIDSKQETQEQEIPKKIPPPIPSKEKKPSLIKPVEEIVASKQSNETEEMQTPFKKVPFVPPKENKPKLSQKEPEIEEETSLNDTSNQDESLKKPNQEDRNSSKYVKCENKMKNRKAMSFRPNETNEVNLEEEDEPKVLVPLSPPPPHASPSKEIPKIKIVAPKEMKKIQKPWSKKKSGGIHFLTEFGQFFKKEMERRHEKELEEHANSASIFGIGEATNYLFEFNEEEQKEKKVKKKKGHLIMKQLFNGKWKKVYCILRKDKLVYYKSKKSYQDGESQISSIFLLSATIEFEDHINHEFCFNLISRGDNHIFECVSEEERKDWVFDIRDVINDRWKSPETNTDTNTTFKKIGKIKNPNYIENANIEYIRHY
jgi:hypothetical protein